MGDRCPVHVGWLRGGHPIKPSVAAVYILVAVWIVPGVYFNYRYNLRGNMR